MRAVVKPVIIKQRLSRWNLIRFQVLMYCSLRNLQLTAADLDMLTLLAIKGETELINFCQLLTTIELSTGVRIKKQSGKEKEYRFIFNSSQSARNAISKISELGLIKREGKSHVKIQVSPEMEIHTDPNLLVNYQFLCLGSDQS